MDADGFRVTEFDKLTLRNGGQDFKELHVRDDIARELADGLRFSKQAKEPCVVFLDGEFWGYYTIQEKLDEEYVESHYLVDENNVELFDYIDFNGNEAKEQTEQPDTADADAVICCQLRHAVHVDQADAFRHLIGKIYLWLIFHDLAVELHDRTECQSQKCRRLLVRVRCIAFDEIFILLSYVSLKCDFPVHGNHLRRQGTKKPVRRDFIFCETPTKPAAFFLQFSTRETGAETSVLVHNRVKLVFSDGSSPVKREKTCKLIHGFTLKNFGM